MSHLMNVSAWMNNEVRLLFLSNKRGDLSPYN